MLLVITGEPRVGKSTLLLKVASKLRDVGVNLYALIAREIRVNGIRRGFEFIDLITNSTINLALVKDHSDVDYGISIGRYMVDINGCKRAAALLRDAIRADYMLRFYGFKFIIPSCIVLTSIATITNSHYIK
jgi:nucleoside-triphosphatase THEP1